MSGHAHTRKPHRRPHKKSRYGCYECRRRRVKCDEAKPRCSGCAHREAACQYQYQEKSCAPVSRSQSEVTTTFQVDSTSGLAIVPLHVDASEATSGTSTRRSVKSRELELMHYWCTQTCHSFTPYLTEIFRDQVGKEALHYDFLMSALLALTSFQIAIETEDATNARSYSSAALQYHNQALSGLSEVLHSISPLTCNAIFAASAMLAICAVVSPLLHVGLDDEVKSIAEGMLPVIDILRGTSSIVDVSRQWLLQGPLGGVLRSAVPRQPSTIKASFPALELRQLNNVLLSSNRYDREGSDNGVAKHQIFEDAVYKLEQALETGVSMLPWLLKIDSGFMDELRKGESMAVAIFLHWSVLLDRLDDMWWARYCGKRLVKRLSGTLGNSGSEWEQVNQWCRVQVGLSL